MKTNDDIQGVGRHGKLRLVFRRERDRTILSDSFSVIPMRVFPPFYPDGSGCAYSYIVNPTSGLVGGDRVELEITLERDAHALVTSPSATKVYKSSGAYSESFTNITLNENAVLEYLPRYMIPFAGAKYSQHTRVTMAPGSSLLLLDAFTTGRTARHEHLAFGMYRAATEIIYGGRPVLTDRFFLDPGSENYGSLGFLEGYTVCAALYIVIDKPSSVDQVLSGVDECLKMSEGITGAASTLPSHGVTVRLLGNSVQSLERALFRIVSASRKMLYGMESAALERLMQ